MLGVIPQSIRGPDCQDYFLQSFSVFFTGTGCKFPNMTCAVANAAVLPYVWEPSIWSIPILWVWKIFLVPKTEAPLTCPFHIPPKVVFSEITRPLG